METINERIKKVRIEENLKQAQFAERLGIRQSSLSDIENGKTKFIDERNIKIICQEFNISEKWLRDGEGSMRNQTDYTIFSLLGERINSLSEIERRAIMDFIKLPEKQKELIMDFMRKLNG